MLSPGWENLDDFLRLGEFAVVARIETLAGEVREVRGIYDEPFLNAELGEYDLDTVQPRFLCRADQVNGVTRGDILAVNGKVLDVMGPPQADGTGMATLRLTLQE